MKKSTRAAFLQLAAMAPELQRLLADIKAYRAEVKGRKHTCANLPWLRRFKPRMHALVGFESTYADPTLRTSEAYDVAYDYLYHHLPDCRACMCYGVEQCEGCDECRGRQAA